MSLRAINQEPSRENLEEKSFLYHKQNSGRRVSRSSTKGIDHGGKKFKLPKARPVLMSPIRFLKHIAGEIARAFCMVSGKRKPSSRSGRNYSSARSKHFVTPLDSHRVEAIEDCIQFINSSCTLSRSNSTTTTINS